MISQRILFILTGMAVLFAASCNKPVEPKEDNQKNDGSVYITVSVDTESGTKATIAESDGAFAFSKGDQIKIYDGTAVYTGSTASESNQGVFGMPDAFNLSGSGFAGFPASLVSTISGSGVTFNLPSSYTFTQVGDIYSNLATDKPKITTPMMGTYNAESDHITLKQAGSMVRFLLPVSQIGEGSVTFLFQNKVSGSVTLAATPTAKNTSSGILSSNLNGSYSITVTISSAEWTSILGSESSYVYFSIPVPTGTTIDNDTNAVQVTWTNAEVTKTGKTGPGSSVTLNRAAAYRLSASVETVLVYPTFKVAVDRTVVLAPGNLMAHIASLNTETGVATADEWKFGGPFEVITTASGSGNYLFANNDTGCEGKWIDLISWQGNSCSSNVHGLYNGTYDADYHGNVESESVKPGCWRTDTDNANPPASGYIHITNGGEYTWRPMTSDEWAYLFNSRTGATINSVSGWRYTRAQVSGINGLLIFPDKETEIWNTSTMGSYPVNQNPTGAGAWDDNTYTASNMYSMFNIGIIFLPCVGVRLGTSLSPSDEQARYWTSTGAAVNTAYRVAFKSGVFTPSGDTRYGGGAIRLVRDVAETLDSPAQGDTGLAADWE